MEEKIYFKVYKDKENMDEYYIDTEEGLNETIEVSIGGLRDGYIGLCPVFEPILMTEDEFNRLPEFIGF